MEEGMVENFILSALYTYSKDGVVLIMLATHADDCLWGNLPEVEYIMGVRSNRRFSLESLEKTSSDSVDLKWCKTRTSRSRSHVKRRQGR